MKNLARAQQLFEKNKEVPAVHFTSDGFAFFSKAQAEGHASRLSERAIQTITREEAAEQPNGDVNKGESATAAVKPLNKMNKAELLAEVAKRPGLTIDDKATKEVIQKTIEDFDANANSTTV